MNGVTQTREELANERLESSKKRIANCLNILESVAEELNWACDSMKWNDDVVYQINEASTKLGYALATLYNFHDDPE